MKFWVLGVQGFESHLQRPLELALLDADVHEHVEHLGVGGAARHVEGPQRGQGAVHLPQPRVAGDDGAVRFSRRLIAYTAEEERELELEGQRLAYTAKEL